MVEREARADDLGAHALELLADRPRDAGLLRLRGLRARRAAPAAHHRGPDVRRRLRLRLGLAAGGALPAACALARCVAGRSAYVLEATTALPERGWPRVRHQDAGRVHRTRGKGWRARPEPPGSASEDCTVRPLGGAISRAPGSEHAERDSPHRHEAIRKPPQTGLDAADFSDTRPTARWSLPADLHDR